jgi:hypothetical protein
LLLLLLAGTRCIQLNYFQKPSADADGSALVLLLLCRYVLSSNFTIAKNLVLLGAGVDATTLYFTNSFEDLYGNTANYAAGESSQWAFGPGDCHAYTAYMCVAHACCL